MAEIKRFAWVVDESLPRSSAIWDQEIARTDHFIALPSAGALVAGWTLVVPRRPMINLAHATSVERSELSTITAQITRDLGQIGQSVFCFEHGASEPGSVTGCGVDQAHQHIVPLPFDLLAAARRRGEDTIEWEDQVESADPLASLPKHGEYVAIWGANMRAVLVGRVRRPVSQWVRRVIAEELGIAAEWDYRSHPQNQRVQETLRLLKTLRTKAR